jgi:hypothetical protein
MDLEKPSPKLSDYSKIIRNCFAAFLLGYLLGIGELPPIG